MEIEIKKLKHYPQFVETVAKWAYYEWHERNGTSYSLVKKDYSLRKSDTRLPITWLAFYRGIPVGMVSVKKFDLHKRKDLTPWLSALYVEPEFRHNGIGKQLVLNIIKYIQKQKYPSLYLFTDRSNNERLTCYYKKMGWTVYDKCLDLHKYPVTIMRYKTDLI